MARPKKRPRVGTILGTEDRNDDETIARTPRLVFDVRGPEPTPNETTTTVDRTPSIIPTDSGGRDEGGDGSGSNGAPGSGTPAGGRDPSLADLSEMAISAVSNIDPANAPPGIGNMVGVVSDVLGEISTEAFGEFGDKPGLGFQGKQQAVGTVTQARSRSTPTEQAKQDKVAPEEYAPPEPTFNPNEKSYNPQDYQSLSDPTGGADQSNPDGPAGAGSHGGATNPGQDQTGGQGAGSADGGNSSGGDTGGGAGVGDGGVGGPGDPAGSPGSGAFDKGGEIKGENPQVDGEIVTSTFKEGEMVLVEDVKDAIGKKKLDRANQIALRKDLSRKVKQRQIMRTLAS